MPSRFKKYEKRMDRVVAILNKLDRGEKISTQDLAEEFGVTLRTVQRDLECLHGGRFPLSSPEKGEYVFEEGFSLRKPSLTNEEASLLAFLYDNASSMGENFEKAYQSILSKLSQKEFTTPFYAKIPVGMKLKKEYPFAKELEDAIDNSNKINIDYDLKGKIRPYKLCPLRIVFYDGFWYLLCLHHQKDCFLKFRLEKIKNVEVLYEESFVEPEDLDQQLKESVNIWFSEKRDKKITLKIDKEVASFFKQRKYFPLQKIKKQNKDGSLLIETKASEYMEVAPTILHWIPYVTVVEPKELRQKIRKTVEGFIKDLK
jgi:predicted DNA-binding transcriptional regulator YafY